MRRNPRDIEACVTEGGDGVEDAIPDRLKKRQPRDNQEPERQADGAGRFNGNHEPEYMASQRDGLVHRKGWCTIPQKQLISQGV